MAGNRTESRMVRQDFSRRRAERGETAHLENSASDERIPQDNMTAQAFIKLLRRGIQRTNRYNTR